MSGYRVVDYKQDIISILKHANMYHQESIGLILGDTDLSDYLAARGLLVSDVFNKLIKWDYIFIAHSKVSTRNALKALENLTSGGIVILDVTEKQSKYQDKYLRLGLNNSATKVQYDDRYYLVIHSGEDYGN